MTDRRAEIADLIYEARLVDGLRGHAHVAVGQAKGYMLDAADWIDAAKAELTRLTADLERMREAAAPFVRFAKNIDEAGWKSNIHREGISVWFGPSEFRALAAAARPEKDEGNA